MLVAALAGLGNATFHPVDFTILNQRVSAPRLGYAFSAHGLTGNLGWAVAPVFFAGLGAALGWRHAYVAAALMYAAILALLVVQRDNLSTTVARRDAQPCARAKAEHDMAFMKLPVVWWCFGFFLLSTMTLAVVQSFSVSILKAMHGVSFEAATLHHHGLHAVRRGGHVCGRLCGGPLAQQSTAWWPGPWRRVRCCWRCAARAAGRHGHHGGAGDHRLCGGHWRSVARHDDQESHAQGGHGPCLRLVYSGLDTGFAISPLVFGVFMDRGWYGATLLGAALLLLLSVGAALGVGYRTAASRKAL